MKIILNAINSISFEWLNGKLYILFNQVIQEQGHGGHGGGYSAPAPQHVQVIVQRQQSHGGHGGYSGGHGHGGGAPAKIIKVTINQLN